MSYETPLELTERAKAAQLAALPRTPETCGFPADGEHDHDACVDAVLEREEDNRHAALVNEERARLASAVSTALAEVWAASATRDQLVGDAWDAEHEGYRSSALGVLLDDIARQLIAAQALVEQIHRGAGEAVVKP